MNNQILGKVATGKHVFIKGADRNIHTFVSGISGTGKSALLANMWNYDTYSPHAKIMIDPSGFLARDCYSLSRGKAMYCSLETPISINPMLAPHTPDQISDNIAEAMNQVVEMTTQNKEMTAKMRPMLDEAVKSCLDSGKKSLIHVLNYLVAMKGNSEAKDGIIQRLMFILKDDAMRPILCGKKAIQWGKLISKRKSFILDCHGMSPEKMIFTGTIVTLGLKNYFRSERLEKYHPLALYIDEFHNFLNRNFFDILKEGRKYNISATLATQDLITLGRELATVVLNCGNYVVFRSGYMDAQLIGNETGRDPRDIQFLEKYHALVKTDNKTGIIKTLRPPLFRKLNPLVKPKRKTKGWFTFESYQPC